MLGAEAIRWDSQELLRLKVQILLYVKPLMHGRRRLNALSVEATDYAHS